MTPSASSQRWGLAGWLGASFAVASLGALASLHAQAFYAALVKPTWAPPAYLFGPVWAVLYLMMAVAAWLVWRSGGFRDHPRALTAFIVQLLFNALWSWLFFAWHLGAAAFGDILLLWLLIAAMLVSFWRVQRWAGALLIPYLAWVSFASALNYSVWRLNPNLLG